MLSLMKYLVPSFMFILASFSPANAGDAYVETLLNICTTAQNPGDLGTIKSIANQVKNEQIPGDELLTRSYNECLKAAFGETENAQDISVLLNRISDAKNQIIADCDKLLVAAPKVAIAHPTCKEILIK